VRCTGLDFSVTDSQQSTEAMPCRKQSGVIIRRGRRAGSFVYTVLATSLRDCLQQTARIYIGRELYAVHTDVADKAWGNSSGAPSPRCANQAHTYKRTKVRTEELWRVIFINVDVFFPFVYTIFLRQSWRNAHVFFYLEDVCVCVCVWSKCNIKSWCKNLRKSIKVYMNLIYWEFVYWNCIK